MEPLYQRNTNVYSWCQNRRGFLYKKWTNYNLFISVAHSFHGLTLLNIASAFAPSETIRPSPILPSPQLFRWWTSWKVLKVTTPHPPLFSPACSAHLHVLLWWCPSWRVERRRVSRWILHRGAREGWPWIDSNGIDSKCDSYDDHHHSDPLTSHSSSSSPNRDCLFWRRMVSGKAAWDVENEEDEKERKMKRRKKKKWRMKKRKKMEPRQPSFDQFKHYTRQERRRKNIRGNDVVGDRSWCDSKKLFYHQK